LFADQAAVSLENARLLEETRQRAAHLEAVTSIASALRSCRTREETFPVVIGHLQDLLRPDGALIALEDPSTQEVVIERSAGVWRGLQGIRQDGTRGVLGRVMTQGQPVVEARAGEMADVRYPLDLGSTSALALMPLADQEDVLGAIGVGRAVAFDEAERRLLMALAEVVGNALRRLRILETLEERVRLRTQELAEANERLTELDRLKSNFVSNVSHELRTPITNILLYLDLLQQPGREDRRDTYLLVLRRESERLGHLIEDLLTLSRMDQAALKISRELRALDPLLAEVVTAHRARAQAKGIVLTLEPNADTPPIWIGYQPMVQVFTNLVGNAVAYTQTGGHVILGSLVRRKENGEMEVGARVWNDGPPILPDDLPRLFQRFYRGRTGRESGEPGTGLGLAICKEIVDRHGGRIEVDSTEEKGTSFTVWLPPGDPV
jgi:signal transduction histidine kinase